MITKMTITPCILDKDGNVTGVEAKGKAFTVPINPSNFTRNFEIIYNNQRAMGTPVMQPKYSSSGEKKIDFEIVIDGTGVVTSESVDSQMKRLTSVVYKMVGKNHEPNTVMLVWGDFKFCGKLTCMSVECTMFKPDGSLLRVKVKLEFIQYIGPKEAANDANLNSPDLTHSVEVKAGDSLPLLCYRIYKDSAYYLEVARINGLSNFRKLQPGTRLQFPPLR